MRMDLAGHAEEQLTGFSDGYVKILRAFRTKLLT